MTPARPKPDLQPAIDDLIRLATEDFRARNLYRRGSRSHRIIVAYVRGHIAAIRILREVANDA